MAAILISVGVINCENLACNKRGVHIRGMQHSYAMTRRDFVKPAFSLRIKRFVKTHALSLLGTTRLLSRSDRSFFLPKPHLVAAFLALWLFQLWAIPSFAGEENPLKPIDTSSPRATLQGFIEFTNKAYGEGFGLINTYLDSSTLYLTEEELASLKEVRHFQKSAERALNLSELPPATVDETARRRMVQLKEILDRIDLPPIESIPDALMMAKSEFKYWVIPNTEIRIQRVEKGARAGEYLFTPDTVERLPEFYAKVKNLPYKANASVGWYDFVTYSPTGVALALNNIVPPRWLLTAPDKQPARATFLDQPAWRWLGIVIVLGIGFIFVRLCFR